MIKPSIKEDALKMAMQQNANGKINVNRISKTLGISERTVFLIIRKALFESNLTISERETERFKKLTQIEIQVIKSYNDKMTTRAMAEANNMNHSSFKRAITELRYLGVLKDKSKVCYNPEIYESPNAFVPTKQYENEIKERINRVRIWHMKLGRNLKTKELEILFD